MHRAFCNDIMPSINDVWGSIVGINRLFRCKYVSLYFHATTIVAVKHEAKMNKYGLKNVILMKKELRIKRGVF